MVWDTPQEFYNRPKDFMDHNIVIPPGSPGVHLVTEDVVKFKIVQKAGAVVEGNAQIGVWNLIPIRADDTTSNFFGYWCDYSQNGDAKAFVGNAHRFFITQRMNGCTLAIGSVVENGKFAVMHLNRGGVGRTAEDAYKVSHPGADVAAEQAGRQAQELAQRNAANADQVFHGRDPRLIEPSAYLQKNVKIRADKVTWYYATTFGYRQNATWVFYTQKYKEYTTPMGGATNRYKWIGVQQRVSNIDLVDRDDLLGRDGITPTSILSGAD